MTTPILPLSAREAEVLRLVAEGLSNPEISRRMHMHESTVKAHVRSVCEALGARGRVNAVARGFQLDILKIINEGSTK